MHTDLDDLSSVYYTILKICVFTEEMYAKPTPAQVTNTYIYIYIEREIYIYIYMCIERERYICVYIYI